MMKAVSIILLFLSLSGHGQVNLARENQEIYHLLIKTFVGKKDFVVNEIFIPVEKYDIDANYQRWFYQPIPVNLIVCVNPIQYENSVIQFLQSRNIHPDTSSIFQQIDTRKIDSLDKYHVPAKLIPLTRVPFSYSFFGNLFKKKKAVGVSRILFDDTSQVAIIKLLTFSKKPQKSGASKIIILQKQSAGWNVLDTISQKQL